MTKHPMALGNTRSTKVKQFFFCRTSQSTECMNGHRECRRRGFSMYHHCFPNRFVKEPLFYRGSCGPRARGTLRNTVRVEILSSYRVSFNQH